MGFYYYRDDGIGDFFTNRNLLVIERLIISSGTSISHRITIVQVSEVESIYDMDLDEDWTKFHSSIL